MILSRLDNIDMKMSSHVRYLFIIALLAQLLERQSVVSDLHQITQADYFECVTKIGGIINMVINSLLMVSFFIGFIIVEYVFML